MDIGTAFLLGFLVGQWVLLFVIWRVLNKLVGLLTEAEASPSSSSSREIVEYIPPKDDYHFKH